MEPDKPINNHIRTKIVIAFLAWIVCSTAQAADLSGVRRVVDARQISEAFPWGLAPSYLVRDNDRAYGHVFTSRVRAMGIRDRPISPGSP
jgi:hypothetical protein